MLRCFHNKIFGLCGINSLFLWNIKWPLSRLAPISYLIMRLIQVHELCSLSLSLFYFCFSHKSLHYARFSNKSFREPKFYIWHNGIDCFVQMTEHFIANDSQYNMKHNKHKIFSSFTKQSKNNTPEFIHSKINKSGWKEEKP